MYEWWSRRPKKIVGGIMIYCDEIFEQHNIYDTGSGMAKWSIM